MLTQTGPLLASEERVLDMTEAPYRVKELLESMVCFYFAREQAGKANTVESSNLTSKGNHQKKNWEPYPLTMCAYILHEYPSPGWRSPKALLPDWGNANLRFGNPNNETILG